MALPNELANAIQAAQTKLAQSASGELSLAARKRIWRAMGPLDSGDSSSQIGAGHIRRTRLFIRCIEHVLPLWTAAYPKHQGPQIMLKAAAKVLDASISEEAAQKAEDVFWSEMDGWQDDQDYASEPRSIGYGSVKVLTTALNDVIFPGDAIFEDETDWGYDAWRWPPDFYASLSYKGDTPEEVARQGGYWQWYLDEAVPAAYASVPE